MLHCLAMDKRVILAAFLVAALVALVFLPALRNDFIVYDDRTYIVENPDVLEGIGAAPARWAMTTFHAANWHPLTWLSHQLDAEVWGLNPAGHHLTSVLLHALAAGLLYLFLVSATGAHRAALLAALLFGIHPLRVESVAWAAERKDVLSAFLWMATLLAYLAWVRRRGAGRYLVLVGCFALGLLAKPMLVSLPVVLLLLDRWPLGRLRAWREGWPRLAEKLPLVVLSAVSAGVTVVAQRRGGAMVFLDALPLANRLANATVGCARYLGMMLFPKGLAVIYPLDEELPALAVILGSAVLLALLTAAAVAVRRRQPWLLAGWGWYLVTLLPVIGIVQVGQQAVADRYTYLPSAGIALMAVWWPAGRPWACRRAALLGAVAAVWLLAMAGLTVRQISFWRGSETLFRRALAVTRGNHVALNNLGLAMTKEGRRDEAKAFYRQVIDRAPNYANARVNLAVLLIEDGDLAGAREHLERTVARYPDSPEAHYNLGVIALKEGDFTRARREFEAALADRPGDPRALNNLGSLALRAGDHGRARELFTAAVSADPRYEEALNNLGMFLGDEGRIDAARDLFRRALERNPNSARALFGLGVLEARRGNAGRAENLFRAALAARPGMIEAERALAVLRGDGRAQAPPAAQLSP